MLQRRAALGLRDMRLELLILVAKPLGVTLLSLAAAKGIADPACKTVGGKYLDVLRAGRGNEAVSTSSKIGRPASIDLSAFSTARFLKVTTSRSSGSW